MISKITNTRENDEDELSTYLKQPPIIYSNEYDILQWWKENNKDLSIMAQIAKDFLSLMPTSVPSEKCFSIGTLTGDKNRTRLHSNTVQELLCLKS
ncbi:zinc finger BED domain-containing DAYSLEEPER-like [Brachionus plicatilis]|uniref:Zinc finger BED domain-containing DAYSLEEPER-like n=1 Tax=Brachionus plicatilis TaxID=10195 RepID=A0A3M7SZX0_BRAPC|nr:zinc finger BED domain-containing DAYSLEEPER-like [Brachionus plicatilis]